ncbi:MAG: putative 4-hydroxybenzoate polyprenyltransferase [Bdellovibrionales bacterium]|nr:putative 4-hydroxybenzoate polyprenyltransferase [Bdellovibrionales bacterium]
MNRLFSRVTNWGHLVKFSHTLFALPFALSMVIVVWRTRPVPLSALGWILVALVCARTAAMGFNRLLDRAIDARNPRTKNRELVTGVVSVREAVALVAGATAGFLLSAAMLGRQCLMLSPVVLFVLFGYSLTKRFTSWSHLVLGLALALAPGGAWFALTSEFSLKPLSLMLAVLFWVAGFDILYSCQDQEFDKKAGLYSIPKSFGLRWAFVLAGVFHFLSVCFLAVFGVVFDLGWVYYVTVAVFAALLAGQYFLVSPENLEKIDIAFFSRNGLASVLFCLGVLLEALFSSSFG